VLTVCPPTLLKSDACLEKACIWLCVKCMS